ncbi:MAG: aminoglycoside phosphotransferase family protein [Chloroflexi bacterium]|nr:aminoglycoside phosphotransferase family protein [Chloroflexota bacterium]
MESLTPLLMALLAQAGLNQEVSAVREASGSGWTNQTRLVELADGQRFVLRVYRWPHAEQIDELRRAKKERFLHRLLRSHGVPVPEILAQVEDAVGEASLLQYLPGELLGDAAPRLGRDDRRQAWRAAGAALRPAHEIYYPPGSHGVIVADTLQPFGAGSWGLFHLTSILEHAERLNRQHSMHLDLGLLRTILEGTVARLDHTRVGLLHNDAHPWNVLVRPVEQGWECSGWLDWEYAWVGDPDWDLVRMDLFRIKPIGPTPAAFYNGYGTAPADLSRRVYTLHIFLWMANDFLSGRSTLPPTYEAAMAYLDSFDTALELLDKAASSS